MTKHFLCLLTIISFQLNAQTVETVAGPTPRINNGLAVHSSGHIYASDLFGSGFSGSRVYKISPTGNHDLYASGLSQPAGLIFDSEGTTLYVAEFTSGEISTIDVQGTVSQFASGFSQPADLVFDSEENLYVTNYGNGTISKITPGGAVSSAFVSGLNQPVGLAIDEINNLYSANLRDGKIYKIDPAGNKFLLTTVNDLPIGFLTYSNGYLYISSTGGHKIYKVDSNGNQTVFAGTGAAGTEDGSADIAQFTNPDGIAASPSGDTLYVSENNTNLLRRIVLNNTSNVLDYPSGTENISVLKTFPNPASDYATILYRISKPGLVEVDLFNKQGEFLRKIHSFEHAKGSHTLVIETAELPSGNYYCRISFGSIQKIIEISVIR